MQVLRECKVVRARRGEMVYPSLSGCGVERKLIERRLPGGVGDEAGS